MIYLIADTDKKYCKIGYSETPEQRIKNIQTAMPLTLEMIVMIPGSHKDEKKLHVKFKHLHIRGEWFQWSEDIENEIRAYVSEPYQPPKARKRYSLPISSTEISTVHKFLQSYANSKDNMVAIPKGIRKWIGAKTNIDSDRILEIIQKLLEMNKIHMIAHEIIVMRPAPDNKTTWIKEKTKGGKIKLTCIQ